MIHPIAASGFREPDLYRSGRPDYPPELADWLRAALHLAPGRAVLDLGSGTGKFLPILRATGARLLAVEPGEAMRAALADAHRDVTALPGTAEAIPLPDASLDAVVCAQAFHWFATPAALAEIARVLRPGGVLGLVWNVRDQRVPWVDALGALMAAYEGDAPRFHTGAWRKPFPAPDFGPLQQATFPNAHCGPPEAVIVGRTLSVSFIAALPEAEREGLARRVRALIAATPELAGRERVTFPYETVAFHCVRR